MEPTMDTPFRWQGMPTTPQNPNMEGYGAAMGSAMANAETAYEDKKLRDELADLERQLAEIDLQIEKFDRENPGMSSGMVDVAAKRAEAGDMGTYNAMVQNAYSMQQGAAGARKAGQAGIWNSIDEAKKLAYGLDDTGDETRDARIANIRVMLDKAKRDADAAGIELPDEWYRLNSEISDGVSNKDKGRLNLLEWGNSMYTKWRNDDLSDEDIKDMEDYIAKNPNGELSKDLQPLVEQYKGKTKEAKAKAKAKNARWENWFNSVVNSVNVAEEIAKLSREEYEEFKKRFTYDPKTGELKRI